MKTSRPAQRNQTRVCPHTPRTAKYPRPCRLCQKPAHPPANLKHRITLPTAD